MKPFYTSKTMLFGFITSLSGALSIAIPFFSQVQPFMTKNEAALTMVWGVVTMVLRSVTKDKVVLSN